MGRDLPPGGTAVSCYLQLLFLARRECREFWVFEGYLKQMYQTLQVFQDRKYDVKKLVQL